MSYVQHLQQKYSDQHFRTQETILGTPDMDQDLFNLIEALEGRVAFLESELAKATPSQTDGGS